MRYFAECRRIKTFLTCIAARSLLSLEGTQQARQNLGAVQDRSRLAGHGRSQEVRIDKSTICQIQLATTLAPSCF